MSTEPTCTPAEQAAYNAGKAAYGPSNGPQRARANNYAADNSVEFTPEYKALRAAFNAGWEVVKEARRQTYWQGELSKIVTRNGLGLAIQIKTGTDSTHWLSLTPAQFEALETFLLTIEETE